MNFKSVFLLLLFACMPAAGQDLQLSSAGADGDVTVGEIDSMIQAVESREDLDEDAKTQVLEYLRDGQTQIQISLDAETATQEYAASLNTAPAELEELRAALDDYPPAGPTTESPETDETTTLGELQQQLAKEMADLTIADSRSADLKGRVEIQISRPTVARERISQLRISRQELATLVESQAAPGEPQIVSDARIFAARLRRTAQGAEINKLEQELLSHPVRLSLLQAKRDMSLRSQEALGERVRLLRVAVNERRQSAAVLAQEAAAAAELAAADKHPVVRALAEDNAELTRELPRRVAEIEATNERLNQVRIAATGVEQRLTRSEQLLEIGGLSSTIGRLLVEEDRTLPPLSKYRAQLRQRSSKLGEIGLAQLRIQEQRRELIGFDHRVQELVSEAAADISDPDEVADLTVEIRLLLRDRRDLLLQVEDSYNSYLQTLSDLDNEQRRLLDSAGRYRAFLAQNLLWIPSASVLFMGSWQDVLPAIGRAVAPDRWLAASAVLARSIADQFVTALLFSTLLVALLVLRQPLARGYAAMDKKVRRIPEDSIWLTFASLGIIIIRVLPVPLLMIMVAWFLHNTPQATVFSNAIARGLELTGPFLFNVLLFRALSAPGSLLGLHFGWKEDSLGTIRRQLTRLATVGTPLLFFTVLLFRSDVASDQATVGRLIFICFLVFLATIIRPITHPDTGIAATYYRRHPERRISKLRWFWFGLSVSLPILTACVSALGYLYTAAILAGSMLETIWRLLALGVVYLIVLRWFALARRKLARQLAAEELQAKLAAEKSHSEGDTEGDAPLATEPPLDIDEVDLQTKTLLRSVLLVIAVFVVWGIWADVLPAFTVMDKVSLWGQTVTVDGVQVIIPVTLGNVVFALLIAVVTSIVSKNLPGLLEIAILQRLTLDPGSRYAIKTLVRYVVVTTGTIMVLNIIGWNWSQIQWLVAALSVGLGFGLQEIVANFVSGLVILFERPVRVGDTVTVGQLTGTVSRVRIRATTITDWDRKEIIVPNKSFITEQVINWTLTDPITRIVVKVGISYGSDVELAHKVMMETLSTLPAVLDDPVPKVYFTEFGDSSLEFTLHAYLPQLSDRMPTIDEIHRAVFSALREHGIEIPFPQRDLHIRSTVESK
jgi:potassium efflux system protein